MPKVTVAISRKVSDNAYGSFEATIGLEDEVPKGTNKDSHAAATRAWVKAFLDETLGDLRKEYLSQEPIARPAVEEFAKEVGGSAVQDAVDAEALKIDRAMGEEKPPLPGEASQTQTPEADASLPSVPKEIRTPIDEAGNELRDFKVQSFEVAESASGKYLKVFGKSPWRREWIPAWKKAAELLFDDLDSVDLGVIGPPYPIKAWVKMGEWTIPDGPKEGQVVPSPDSVDHWERIG